MAQSYESILAALKRQEYAPVYFLHGEEPYFIDAIIKQIEDHAIAAAQRPFNQVVCYGNEIDFASVLSSCRQLPVMAPYRVVIVKEAQAIKLSELDLLMPYLRQPSTKTILAIAYKHKRLDGRSVLAKAMSKSDAVVYRSDKIRDYQLEGWIRQHYSQRDYKLEPKAAALIAEYLGNDLSKIFGEIKKLEDHLESGQTITAALVQEKIGISKDYNVFELQNAIIKNDKKKAFQIVKYFSENPKNHPVIPTIALLFSFFSKVIIAHHYWRIPDKELMPKLGINNSYFLSDYKTLGRRMSREQLYKIFESLKKADMRSKGIGTTSASSEFILFDLMQDVFSMPTAQTR